jgi:hypothetical protein
LLDSPTTAAHDSDSGKKSNDMKIRTQLKAGGQNLNHSEALAVRTTLKAGGLNLNHSEALRNDRR